MDSWIISIEHWGEKMDIELLAESYSEVYIKIGMEYPSCTIISIEPSKNETKKKFG